MLVVLFLFVLVGQAGVQACGDTSVSLTGQIVGGQAIQGLDSIHTVGCK
jgi:hypothetical protein